MIAAGLLDAALAAGVVALGVATVRTRSTLPAVVAFVVLGLLLALAWLRLAAPDVALTEAAIGSGVTGGLLAVAARRLRPTEPAAPVIAAPRLRLAVAALCALVAAGLAAVVLALPEPAPSLAHEALAPLPTLGVGNPITGVLIAYRAIDTLLEKVVLVLALVGVWSLAADDAWGGAPPSLAAGAPSGALRLLGRLLPPVGVVIGAHILWVGKDAPGGAFQGGAILAAMAILTWQAGLLHPPRTGRRLRAVMVSGPLAFVLLGFAGFAAPGYFLAYPPGLATPLILAVEVLLTLSIAVVLALLVAGHPERRAP